MQFAMGAEGRFWTDMCMLILLFRLKIGKGLLRR